MKVYTGNIKFCKTHEYALDITVKSAKEGKIFAPTWDMVNKYKSGQLSMLQYIDMYYALMRESYKKHRKEWNELLSRDKVILCCYCPSGHFCHRVLLANILVKLGAEYMGEL